MHDVWLMGLYTNLHVCVCGYIACTPAMCTSAKHRHRNTNTGVETQACFFVSLCVHTSRMCMSVICAQVAGVRVCVCGGGASCDFQRGHLCKYHVCMFMHPCLNSRHAGSCVYGSSSLSLQTPKVAKIQAVWPIKDPLKVPLTPSTKVAHVLRQFTEHHSTDSKGQEGSEDMNSLLLQ